MYTSFFSTSNSSSASVPFSGLHVIGINLVYIKQDKVSLNETDKKLGAAQISQGACEWRLKYYVLRSMQCNSRIGFLRYLTV